ncbi:MAG: RagB/SusD family nutrient uptake outer membrane protein [Mucilaginibacter sp.]|uniref:RagB/SusD family nutrient uptake outer membrane protein n=1 Tax=Mucilaginibacter sp. TaxID=1882438 RepID=UPI0031A4767F
MKKIFIILTAISILGAGCSKQLEENPKNKISTDKFFSTDAEAIQGSTGVYSWLATAGGFGQSLWRGLDEGTDVSRIRALIDVVPSYTLTASNSGYTASIWTTMYQGVYNANLFIDKVSKSNGISAATKTRVLGEAKFLRSLYYYYLTGLFGDVVYYDEKSYTIDATKNLGRTSADQIRANLVQSLKEAEAALPAKYTGADVGRATKGAAQTLLTKIYLWQKQWKLAQDEAQAIVDSKTYTLQPNYADIFTDANEFGPEVIFEVDFEPVLNGNNHHTWYQPNNIVGVSPFSGRSWYGYPIPYQWFVNSFDAADKRKTSILADSYNGTPFKIDPVQKITMWMGPKFWRLTYPSDSDGGMDVYVFRYADVLLMLAEAANENNDMTTAISNVNLVRARAGLTNMTSSTQQQMRDYLFAERAKELVGEGQRRLDLIRWGKLVPSVKAAAAVEDPFVTSNIQDFHVRYPIPAAEIQKDPALTQNTGY